MTEEVKEEKKVEDSEILDKVFKWIGKVVLQGIMVAVLFTLFFGISIIEWTFVVWKAWGWFVPHLPFDLPILTFVQSLCLMLVGGLIFGRKSTGTALTSYQEAKCKKEDKDGWGIASLKNIGMSLVTPIFAFFIFLVIHMIIGHAEPQGEVIVDEPEAVGSVEGGRPWDKERKDE